VAHLIPNPILKVLSTLSCHEVRHLLIGGQACVLYGAAEFSRDCDVVILADESNLQRLQSVVVELQAKCIAFPEFKIEYLVRGHAVHFRCYHPEVENLRLDIMTKMRGCDDFETLWERRTTIEDQDANSRYEVLSIEDLVIAKKTQRDKDWPMIRRLVEAHYDQFSNEPNENRIRFWLRESRSSEMILEVLKAHPRFLNDASRQRPWLTNVSSLDIAGIETELKSEERIERELDEIYWRPLKKELEELRMSRARRTE
jgi:hypothetical protein